ncbi:MAG: AmmeMemoRadiSam system protein B [Deltaproteobacteria bacterium]|nr:AmmeMemoRadiSam system protein B [Deltaproteobacteria bacterium]
MGRHAHEHDCARPPAVAGRFYPDRPEQLSAALAQLMPHDDAPARARLLVGPHAGWMYSGAIAGATWAATSVPDRVILLAPNHTGAGVSASLWSGGPWLLPGGAIAIDEELRAALSAVAPLQLDAQAHLREHAIEVHLPLLRARNPAARIVPIVLAGMSAAACAALGRAIAGVLARAGDGVLLVASTDMSHYVTAQEAATLDGHALAHVLALDPDGLHRTVQREHISMCGYVPTCVGLHAALAAGAQTARLVRYDHSGSVSGDLARVVGYAGLLVA